jgi:predicted NUDIX family NTP pyrophosphohydrolase
VAAKHSAGILLYRLAGEEPEFLLAHPGGPFWAKKDAGAWTIPKGEVEPGEDAVACALRELREELGPVPEIELQALIELGTVKQRSGKLVDAWAAEAEFDPQTVDSNSFELEWPPRSGNRQSFPEVDRAAWLGEAEAREKILAAQQPFLDRLLDHLGRS